MPDKPQPWFTLPRHALVTLAGRDALAFAQAQFMGDVRPLQPGQWHWNGWLTPKGRVIALFALLVRDPETAWLVLHDAEPDAFATALRRYVFRSKVTIETPGTPICGSARESGDSRETPTGMVELDVSADGGHRTLRIGGEPGIEDSEADAAWARFDLVHGLPRLPASQAEQWTPQQLSLERLRAYSVSKGCYPGQEIVARTHFLGKAKRGLALLEGDAAIEPGSEVRSGERALGTVVCAEGNLALAVMPLEREGGDLAIDGLPIRERPLQGGLARP
jgi:folate-binding protein YgfZ